MNEIDKKLKFGGTISQHSGMFPEFFLTDTNTIRTFINGQQTGSLVSSYALPSGTQNLFIGGIDSLSASSLNGNIDEVRISKGIARWTANFTPPNHEYGPVVTPIANFTATPVSGTADRTIR